MVLPVNDAEVLLEQERLRIREEAGALLRPARSKQKARLKRQETRNIIAAAEARGAERALAYALQVIERTT